MKNFKLFILIMVLLLSLSLSVACADTGTKISQNSSSVVSSESSSLSSKDKQSSSKKDTISSSSSSEKEIESSSSSSKSSSTSKAVSSSSSSEKETKSSSSSKAVSSSSSKTQTSSGETPTPTPTVTTYTVTINSVEGITITVKNGSEIVESGSKIEKGTILTLTYVLVDQYTFGCFTINENEVAENTVTVNSDITISATVSHSGKINIEQSTGGTISANKMFAEEGTTITLSNTPQAGYVFSSYKVNGVSQAENRFTMPSGNVTVEAVFVKGIGGLSNFDFAKNYNSGTSVSGNVYISGNSVTNSQTGCPFVYNEILGDFYYETNVTFAQSDIKNGEQYPKCGIAINCGEEWMFVYIDAISSNGGYGNNTWLIATNGRGALGSGVDWYWADVQERKFNFEKNYSNETTFKLGVLKVGTVYKFFIEDKLAYSLWLPEMNDAVNIGIHSFNVTYRCTETKFGDNSQVVTNAKAYYGLTDNQNPTSITIDGYAGDWKENAVTTYGMQSGLKYFYASAFKGTDAVYAVIKARSSNYINNSSWWQSTNAELRYGGADDLQMYASANGETKNITQAVFNDKEENGLHTITIELKIPLSLWSGTPTIGFAFRSEDNAGNMCEGSDSVWWCGMTHINSQNFKITTTGLDITMQTTPTESSIRTSIGADPFVLLAEDGMYYMYYTGGIELTAHKSSDLKNWTDAGYVFYTPSSSRISGNPCNTFAMDCLWAPEVVYNPTTKKYVMFYSGYLAQSGDLAYPKVGVATADTPLGPFVDVHGSPLLYANETMSTIDPSFFLDDDGQAYLYYSKDCQRNYIENYRNGQGYGVSQTWVVKLDSTYTNVTSDPILCVTPDQDWEFNEPGTTCWNEGPFVYKQNGYYYLMYSANPYWNVLYGVGLAISKSPTGPFTKYANNPIVKRISGVTAGTGHNMFFKDKQGKLWCAYHTYKTEDLDWDKDTNNKGRGYPLREAMFSRVWFKDGIPKIEYSR